MKKITKDTVLEAHKKKPKREIFSGHSGKTGIHGSKNTSWSFRIKFSETIQEIFEADTGLNLFDSKFSKSFYRMIKNYSDLKLIKKWEEKQGTRVFLRDCLSLSIALDFNLIDNVSKKYTEIGELENKAKKDKDKYSQDIVALTDLVHKNIIDLPYYKDADYICAIPSSKNFNFPSKNYNFHQKKF